LALFFHLSAFIGIISVLVLKFIKPKSIKFYQTLFFLSVLFYLTKIGKFFLEYLLILFSSIISFTGLNQLNRYFFYEDLLNNPTESTSFRVLLYLLLGGIFAFSDSKWISKNSKLLNLFFLGL